MVKPTCYGDYRAGTAIGERHCNDCPIRPECKSETVRITYATGLTRPGPYVPPVTGPESDIYNLTELVVKWADSVPQLQGRTPEAAFRKMVKEIGEWADRPADGHEAADVFLIFLDVCHLTGIDIVKALHYKMRINANRKWEIGEDGLVQHVKGDGNERRD